MAHPPYEVVEVASTLTRSGRVRFVATNGRAVIAGYASVDATPVVGDVLPWSAIKNGEDGRMFALLGAFAAPEPVAGWAGLEAEGKSK